jgi:hypothetical protein
MPSFSPHLTLQFVKTLDSWLFHITKICSSKYNIEKSQDKITFQYIKFLIVQKIHTTIWTWKSLHKFILLSYTIKKNSIQITTKFIVLWKRNQTAK